MPKLIHEQHDVTKQFKHNRLISIVWQSIFLVDGIYLFIIQIVHDLHEHTLTVRCYALSCILQNARVLHEIGRAGLTYLGRVCTVLVGPPHFFHRHRRSQDFVWGAFFFSEKDDDLF